MRRLSAIFIGAQLAGCGSSGPSLDRASIGNLDYGVPARWSARDYSGPDGRAFVEWRPTEDDLNEHKEALVVLHSGEREALAKAGPNRMQRVLNDALRSLPSGKFSSPIQFTTRNGFEGVRVDGEFVPPGQGTPYQRFHAVLVDGKSFVHVIATGKQIDREEFEAVVESFARKGA